MSTFPLLQKPPYQIMVSPRGLAVLVRHAFVNVTLVIRVVRHGTTGTTLHLLPSGTAGLGLPLS